MLDPSMLKTGALLVRDHYEPVSMKRLKRGRTNSVRQFFASIVAPVTVARFAIDVI